MGTNDVEIYRGSSLDQRIRYATLIADAKGLLPDGVYNPAHALLIFEQAVALGIPPITGLSQIHIIKGRPTMGAALMSGKIRQAGHRLRIWTDGKVEDESLTAYAELIRSDDPDFTFKVEFSLKDARRAGLYPGKSDSNWSKWPRSMVKARVTSEIAREAATDVFLGAIYTPEELDPSVQVDEQGEMVATAAPQQQYTNLSPETTESSDIKAKTDGMPAEIRAQWFEQATQLAGNYDRLVKFHAYVKEQGLLDILDPEDDETTLAKYVTALGTAAKNNLGVPVNADPETGEVADEVIDAEVIEDEGPAAVLDPAVSGPEKPAKAPAARRTRKPANGADAATSQG